MIELLFKKLEVKRKLSEQSKGLLSDLLRITRFEPGQIFLDKGSPSNQVGFIFSGVFRSYVYQRKTVETTIEFIERNNFLSNLKSFHERKNSENVIECELAGDVGILTRDTWDICEREIPGWRNTMNYIHSYYLLELHNFQREILNQEALTCYRCFCEKFPAIVHAVPLGHIASYLGITQSTLSRIRKKDFDQ